MSHFISTAEAEALDAPAGDSASNDQMPPRPRWMLGDSSAHFLNANQRASIAAMIAYIASRSGQPAFRLERNLSDYFNVPNPMYLLSSNFDEALRYLADHLSA